MTQADKLVDWAEKQLGTSENPPGSNRIRYNDWYWGEGVSGDNYPYCMAFVCCGFYETGLSKLFYDGKKTASCTALMNWAKRKGYFVTGNYRKGDVLFYDWDGVKADSEHTGIYTGEKEGSRYAVIEGNAGDKVDRFLRPVNQIIGAFRPQWTDEAGTDISETPSVLVSGLDELKKGSVGEQVKTLQAMLVYKGYSCGRHGPKKDGVDGEFGDDTQLAVLRFQNKNGLERDGICGVRTWTRLLKG